MKVFTIVAAFTALALTPAAAQSAEPHILGPTDGATATRTGNAVDVRFSPAAVTAAGLKAGSEIEALCTNHHSAPALAFSPDPDDVEDAPTAFASAKVGADGVARLKLEALNDVPSTLDGCDISRIDRKAARDTTTTEVARVGLTPAGVAWAEVSALAAEMRDLLVRAHGAQGYRAPAELGADVVALAGPDASPEIPDRLGYWTDGAHAAVVTVTSAGRRLVTQDQGDGMLRTNVLQDADPFVFAEDDLLGDMNGGSGRTDRDPENDRGESPYTGKRPMTPSDGVRASVHGQRLAIRFTGRSAKAFRAVAGRKVMIVCSARPARTLFPTLSFAGYRSPAMTRVPRHGGRVVFTLRGKTGDSCLVADDGKLVAIAAPTDAGNRWWHDLSTVIALSGDDVEGDFAAKGATSYPSTAAVVAAAKKSRFVALDGPAAAPPTGRIGVWTDGAKHAVLAARSATGRRFVLEDEGDGMVRTNVFGELSGLWFVLALGDDA